MKQFFVKWKKPFLYGLAAVLILLVVTNPSLNNLKDYLGLDSTQRKDCTIRKSSNYLIFSIYKDNVFVSTPNEYNQYSGYPKDVYYLGILSNFFKLN